MNKKEIQLLYKETKKYFVARMGDLCEDNRTEDACALYEEMQEWLSEDEKPIILTIRRVSKI